MPSFSFWYLLLIAPALLAWYAQQRVRQVHERYANVVPRRALTGVEAARLLLNHYGLSHVTIERTKGHLTDHYDPGTKALRLSDEVANTASVTALGIVAHETAHAQQDAESFRLMRVRTTLANRLSRIAPWASAVFVGGLVLQMPILMIASGLVHLASLIFSLITLPMERDASRRALTALQETGLAQVDEADGASQVLRAATLTYLAGLGQRLGTFFFFVVMAWALVAPLRP